MSGGEGKRLVWENKTKQKTAVVLAKEHTGLDKDGSRGDEDQLGPQMARCSERERDPSKANSWF